MKSFLPLVWLVLAVVSFQCMNELLAPDVHSRPAGSKQAHPLSMAFPSSVSPLRVDYSMRFLDDQSGNPVFLSGDAAWSLIAQLNAADANTYLANRSQLGFNLVLVNLIEHLFSNNAPANIYGVAPFTGRPFATPNPAYFQYADSVISMAASYGITVLLDPLYLGYACGNQGWCAELTAATPAELGAWGSFLGRRYARFPNIIWCIGGDTDPTAVKAKVQTVVDSIRAYDPNHIFTAHNDAGEFAVTPWSGATWLNLNDVYSYSTTMYADAKTAYRFVPTMPYFLIESAYEGEHSSTAQSLRAQAYWSILSGACGEVFGNNPIWLFGSGWQAALSSAGSTSMKYLALLFNSRYWYKLVPDFNNTIITAGRGSSTTYATACWTSDSSSIIAYLPTSRAMTLTAARLSGSSVTCYWYNPSNGAVTSLGTFPKGSLSFTPPGSGDWIFVADAATSTFPLPGGGSAIPLPSGSFSATPSSLPIGGGQTTLSWTSQNDTSASISQGIGPVPLNGSIAVSLTATTAYVLTLSGTGGSQQYALTVGVATPPKPTGTFTATPTGLPYGGGQVKLAWTSQNATSDSITGIGVVGLNDSTIVRDTTTTTHTLTLTGPGGTQRYQVTVTVAAPAKPTGTFTVTPANLPYGGGQVKLQWTSQNATADTINQGIGAVGQNDSTVVTAATTTTYTLSLSGPGGRQQYSATVTVAPPTPPSGTFTSTPPNLPVGGGRVKLAWSSQNATSASINQGIGTVGLSDSTVLTILATTSYTLTLTGPGGSKQYPLTVNVALPPPPTVTLSATPASLPVGGGQTVLRWSSQNASTATFNQGIGTVALNDSLLVTDAVTTTYILTVTNSQGSASASVTVSVAVPPPPFEAMYDDAYENGWNTVRSWSVTLTPANTSPVEDGTHSLKVVHAAWASLQFSKGTWGAFPAINPANYTALSFWINGGTAGVSGLVVSCINSSGSNIKTVTVPNIPANTWVQQTIPMASLAGTTSFVAVGFTDGGKAVTFYLDDIQLNH
jgi:hypothetical protein